MILEETEFILQMVRFLAWMVTVKILVIWILKSQKLKAMETRLLKTNTKPPQKYWQTPEKTPAFMDLKPFFFKPNLGIFF